VTAEEAVAAAAKEAAAAASAVEAAAAAEEPAAAQETKEVDALAQTGSALDPSPAPPCPLQLPPLPRNRSNQSTSNPASSPFSPGAHPQRRLHGQMPRPMGRRAPAPTASPTSIRKSRRRHTVISAPRAVVPPAPTAKPQGVRPKRRCTRHDAPRTVVLPRPFQLQVPAQSGLVTRLLTPRGVVLPRPLNHFQVPALDGAAHVS